MAKLVKEICFAGRAQSTETYDIFYIDLPIAFFFLHNDIISYQNVFEILQQASCGKYALHKGLQQFKIIVVFTTKA